jgi:hypothetical protein
MSVKALAARNAIALEVVRHILKGFPSAQGFRPVADIKQSYCCK